MSQKPKKERRPKLKRINVSAKNQWKHILKDVDKDEIPIGLLLSITVNLIDGSKVKIDVARTVQPITDHILKNL
jgi:hypothetical protein